jgi:hypothetical protein
MFLAFVLMLLSAALIGQNKLNNSPPQNQPNSDSDSNLNCVAVINPGFNNQIHNENILSGGEIILYLTIFFCIVAAPLTLSRIGIITYTPKVFAYIYVIHYINKSIIAPFMLFASKSKARKYLYNIGN